MCNYIILSVCNRVETEAKILSVRTCNESLDQEIPLFAALAVIQRAIHPTNVHFLAVSFRFNETVESRPSRDVPSSNGRSYYRHYKYMVTRHERGSVCVISTTALVRFASGLPARYRSRA